MSASAFATPTMIESSGLSDGSTRGICAAVIDSGFTPAVRLQKVFNVLCAAAEQLSKARHHGLGGCHF